jgi:ribosomal-protein-alanine N-acetyltransferase
MNDTVKYPKLETERLLLRKLTDDDITGVSRLFSDPEITRYDDNYPTKSDKDVKEIIDWGNGLVEHNAGGLRGVFLKNSGEFIGAVNWVIRPDENFSQNTHRAEIGYHLRPEYWGKGYISEAVKSVIHYIFTKTKIDRLEAKVTPENTRSSNVLLRAGFTKEAVFRQYVLFEGKHIDKVFYSLLKLEWEAKNSL